MPPTVILIRHAQAKHNVARDWSIPDPHLTPLGETQAKSLSVAYPKLYDSSDVILTSPLKRTIQTTLFGFPKLPEGKKVVEIMPDLQETQDLPCDTGSSRDVLEAEFTEPFLDFSRCTEGWNSKTGRYAPTKEAFDARALSVRRMLRGRSEKTVTVVCHAGFLKHLVMLPHVHVWKNVEARIYRFPTDDPDDEAILEQLPPEVEAEYFGARNEDILSPTW